MKALSVFLTVGCALHLAFSSSESELFSHPVATLPSGSQVKGKYKDATAIFHAIPFATPPLGDLRFSPPVPLNDNEDVDATNFKHMCPQFQFDHHTPLHLGNEDCLHLSVYVPAPKSTFPPTEKKPVMFWIFGGAFVLGDGMEFGWYDGINLSEYGDVIIVAGNYRVGAFGFLAHNRLVDGDGGTGNYGIQDQRMALEWVRDNIAAFGGDPDNVTIFGQSAGAMSVCSHLANPVNRGLFHRAIMQSGNCNSAEFFQTKDNAMSFGRFYSELVGCEDDDDYLECMRGKPTGDIMYGMFRAWEIFRKADPDYAPFNTTDYMPSLTPLMPFGPVIDGVESGNPKLPYDALVEGDNNRVPVIIGSTSNEGSLFLPMLPSIVKGVNGLPLKDSDVPLIIHHVLDPVIGVEKVDESMDELMLLYDIDTFGSYDAQLSRILRDYMFTCSARRAARALRSFDDEPVFMYQFNYMARWLDFKVMGDYHTSELYFLFDNSWPPIVHRFDKEDKEMAAIMETYWTNFARSGDPNSETESAEWEAWTEDDEKYLELNNPSIGKMRLASDACDFHDDLLGFV